MVISRAARKFDIDKPMASKCKSGRVVVLVSTVGQCLFFFVTYWIRAFRHLILSFSFPFLSRNRDETSALRLTSNVAIPRSLENSRTSRHNATCVYAPLQRSKLKTGTVHACCDGDTSIRPSHQDTCAGSPVRQYMYILPSSSRVLPAASPRRISDSRQRRQDHEPNTHSDHDTIAARQV